MRISGHVEGSLKSYLDWIPGISTLNGLIKLLTSSLFSKKTQQQNTPPPSIKGRVQFWDDNKRAKIALVPVFGNAAIVWHDCGVYKAMKKLNKELKNASGADVEKVFKQYPADMRESKTDTIKLLKINPKILQYSLLTNDGDVMLAAAKSDINNLKFASQSLKENPNFITNVFFKTNEDLFAACPELIDIYKNNPQIMLSMALKNSGYLNHAPDLLKDQSFVLRFAALNQIYPDNFNILALTPDLCKNEDFLLEACEYHKLNMSQYIPAELKNKEDFILKLLEKSKEIEKKKINRPGGMTINERSAIGSLKNIASPELLKDAQFIKKAMKIDIDFWSLVPEKARTEIFKDKEFLQQYYEEAPQRDIKTGNFDTGYLNFMVAAVKYNPDNTELITKRLCDNPYFKDGIRSECPKSTWNKLYPP